MVGPLGAACGHHRYWPGLSLATQSITALPSGAGCCAARGAGADCGGDSCDGRASAGVAASSSRAASFSFIGSSSVADCGWEAMKYLAAAKYAESDLGRSTVFPRPQWASNSG